MALVDTGEVIKDYYSNLKQLVIDDIAGSDVLSLNGASNIYMYDIDFPSLYPCLKIIPAPFGRIPENVAMPNMFRLYPRAIIEYHVEEIDAELGPLQAAEGLYNMFRIFLKDTTVNGWGMERYISNVSVLRDDADSGAPVRIAAFIHEGASDQISF